MSFDLHLHPPALPPPSPLMLGTGRNNKLYLNILSSAQTTPTHHAFHFVWGEHKNNHHPNQLQKYTRMATYVLPKHW